MTMLEAALEYAAKGWRVFPLKGKHPTTAHGHLDATTDHDTIVKWWAGRPDANVGAPVPAQLVVLDIDPRNGGSYESLVGAIGPLPPTLTAWSGRRDGGRHLYFLRPPGALTSKALPVGVDLKANGYMVMPPSTHPDTGMPYEWGPGQAARLPYAVRERLRPPPPRPRPMVRTGDGKGLLKFIAKFPDQGVNNALYWAACRAAEDGTLDALAEDMVHLAVRLGESRHQAAATVNSARCAPTKGGAA